jgi:putative redox protein
MARTQGGFMPSELAVRATYRGEMHITGQARDYTIEMDYPIRPSGMAGATPLELLLVSLAGCAGNAVAALLRRSSQAVSGLEVKARGQRRDEHPTVITAIALEFVVRGSGLDEAVVARAVAQAEERVCPIWAMLKPGTPITSSLRIEPA